MRVELPEYKLKELKYIYSPNTKIQNGEDKSSHLKCKTKIIAKIMNTFLLKQ